MKPTPIEAAHIEMLEWAISLSRAKLDEFREGDWLNLKEDLYNFVIKNSFPESSREAPLIGALGKKEDFIGQLGKDELKDGQQDLKRMLRRVAEERVFTLRMNRNAPARTIFFYGALGPSQRFQQAIYCPDPLSQVSFALGSHLIGSGLRAEQIRVCPECQSLFLAKRKPQAGRSHYCSTKCSMRAAGKAYQVREKKKLQEKAHARYEAKVRRRPGLKTAKISRRPRGEA